MSGYVQLQRPRFLTHNHQRNDVESPFSMAKAKLRGDVRSRTDAAMKNEVLLTFLGHNIVGAHQPILELGIVPEFLPGAPRLDLSAVSKFPGVG